MRKRRRPETHKNMNRPDESAVFADLYCFRRPAEVKLYAKDGMLMHNFVFRIGIIEFSVHYLVSERYGARRKNYGKSI